MTVETAGPPMPFARFDRRESQVAGWIILSYGVVLMVAGPIRYDPVEISFDGLIAGVFQLLLLEIPAIAVVYGGYWVQHSDFDPRSRRRILDWCGWGTLAIGSLTGGVFIRELLSGSSVPDLDFFLLLGVSAGAAGGLVFGIKDQYTRRYAEQVASQAEEVNAQREALFFLNRLLRHNVLNGMNIIQGYAHRMQIQSVSADGDDADVILSQCDRIVDLIDNVHALGKTFAGEGNADFVDLSRILRQEVESARRNHPEAEFETTIPRDIHIRSTELLSTVFEHLLRNAVEHNDKETPRVDVHAEQDGRTVTVRVADNGPGIPDGRKEAIFEADEWGETGIGLYLAKTLVTNFGGTIEIADNQPTGTMMTVRLPSEAVPGRWTPTSIRSAAAGWATERVADGGRRSSHD